MALFSYEDRRSSTIRQPTPVSVQPQPAVQARNPSLVGFSNQSPIVVNPRVQLVPHSRTPSSDASFSPSDIEMLANTSFSPKDISSKDFDFEDVFTYDKPQRKLKSVVQVSNSSPIRDKDWSHFSFSHYQAVTAARQKVNRTRSGISVGEMYIKNSENARKQ